MIPFETVNEPLSIKLAVVVVPVNIGFAFGANDVNDVCIFVIFVSSVVNREFMSVPFNNIVGVAIEPLNEVTLFE